ncbi:hypothetical protein Tco_0552969 [Tanacetum coccineum]
MSRPVENYGSGESCRPDYGQKTHLRKLKGQISQGTSRKITFSVEMKTQYEQSKSPRDRMTYLDSREIGHQNILKYRSTETSDGLAAIQALLNNLGRERLRKSMRKYTLLRIYRAAGPDSTKVQQWNNSSYLDRRTDIRGTLTNFMAEVNKETRENQNIIKSRRRISGSQTEAIFVLKVPFPRRYKSTIRMNGERTKIVKYSGNL